MNHDVPSRRNLRAIAPQDFTDAAAYAIPHDRATQCFLDADAESAGARWPGNLASVNFVVGADRLRHVPRAKENCKLRARAALARAIHGFIFDAFQQPHGTRKSPAADRSNL